MAYISFAMRILLAVVIARFSYAADAGPPFHIKSKEASGSGCAMGHWVDVSINYSSTNVTFIKAQYREFSPEVSPQDPQRFAAKNCQLALELDQVPAGYQFSVTQVYRQASASFEAWPQWNQVFITDVQHDVNGPVARVILQFLSRCREGHTDSERRP